MCYKRVHPLSFVGNSVPPATLITHERLLSNLLILEERGLTKEIIPIRHFLGMPSAVFMSVFVQSIYVGALQVSNSQ